MIFVQSINELLQRFSGLTPRVEIFRVKIFLNRCEQEQKGGEQGRSILEEYQSCNEVKEKN